MSLIPIDDSDIWLTEADVCERLCIEITSQISQRNKEFVTSERYKNLSAGVRVRLNQFNSQVKELRRKLETSTDGLTSEEAERRLRQVEILESKRIRLQSEFLNIGSGNLDRENLLAPGPSLWIDDDYREEPSDREALLKTYTAQKLRRQNEKVIKEQDEGLDNLSKIISRQKDIAIRIHEEVENQNDLLDGLGNDMENVDVRMSAETRHVTEVVRRPSLCGYYMLIFLLLLVLVLVLVLK